MNLDRSTNERVNLNEMNSTINGGRKNSMPSNHSSHPTTPINLMSINLGLKSLMDFDINFQTIDKPVHNDSASKSNINSPYNPKVSLFTKGRSYSGPYPTNCIMNARRYAIEKLCPNNNSMITPDRMTKEDFEILKLKLNIPSVFDRDPNKINLIKSNSIKIRSSINERLLHVNLKMKEDEIFTSLRTNLSQGSIESGI